MRKTSVYLDDDEAEALRRVAASTGRPQADIIREGVRRVIDEIEGGARVFRSLGKGSGGGKPYSPWNARDLYKKAVAKR